jgi:hypothetical protein
MDDVLVGDVMWHASEESPGVGRQALIHLLLHLGQIVVSARSDHGSLEVVDEGPLEVLPGVNGVWLEAFQPSEWCGLQSYWEVESFGRVGSP